ncbi:MAG: hypothetical protein GX970_16555 [Phyllobacteriaceae bacterium]|nr:hypothetical protein [Phyllobacteriaceae bacterium]
MSLESILTNLGLMQRRPSGVEAQIQALQHEIRRVGRTLSRQASHASEDWGNDLGDFGREAARQGAYIASVAGQQAMRGADALRRDPLPAIAIVGTVFLLSRLLKR